MQLGRLARVIPTGFQDVPKSLPDDDFKRKAPAEAGASGKRELRPSATTVDVTKGARRRDDGYGPAESPSNADERPQCSTCRYGPRAGAGGGRLGLPGQPLQVAAIELAI